MTLLDTALTEAAPVLVLVIMALILGVGAIGWWLGVSSGKPGER